METKIRNGFSKKKKTKIRNNWKQKPNGLLIYGSHHFWVMSNGNKVMSYGNHKSKQPLKHLS